MLSVREIDDAGYRRSGRADFEEHQTGWLCRPLVTKIEKKMFIFEVQKILVTSGTRRIQHGQFDQSYAGTKIIKIFNHFLGLQKILLGFGYDS